MLPRVLETEAMDTLDEAVDYDAMDHAQVNRAFVADLLAASRGRSETGSVDCGAGEILDLGTGTARIPIELCRQDPQARVVAVDLAAQMLRVARKNLDRQRLTGRVEVHRVDAKRLPYADGRFATVMSNSIVHHVPHPAVVLREAWRVLAPGGLMFVRDLVRPADEATLARLIATYAGKENQHQRQMFADSFHAALTVEEMGQWVAELGCPAQTVRMTSDRHWTWSTRKP